MLRLHLGERHAQRAGCIAELAPDTVVISSPHAIMYADYIHISPGRGAQGGFSMFGAPQARYEAVYDQEFVRALAHACKQEGLSAGCEARGTQPSTTAP